MSRYFFLLLLTVAVTSCNRIAPLETPSFQRTVEAQASAIIMQDLVISPGDFQDDHASDMALLPEGIMPDHDASAGVYLSGPLKAPIEFNALVPQWIIDQPENSEIQVELRTGSDPAELGDWISIHAAFDWMQPDDEDVVGEMLIVPAGDTKHQFMQYRITLSGADPLSMPLLRELRLTFIDSTDGPTVEEMILQQQELDSSREPGFTTDAATDNPKPFVISRDVWCTNPACDYTDGLEYEPVTHLILHHTVSGTGADGDSAAIVRAIWAYHTSGRGWADIGYNFLADTKGVIYEGHLGGDDVVGIHASGANAGTMALAMIGNYSLTTPPGPMYDSAIDLFAWKADQKNIDVLDASDTLPNIDWGLPNLMGHRDVYGTTECPGGVAHALLPKMRSDVAARTGIEHPFIYIDELSSSYQKSNANWYDGPLQCGHNAHSWYTWSTTDPAKSANSGAWHPLIPESGRYRIEVYAPYCNTGEPETSGAHYVVEHAKGSSSTIVDQNDRVGLWTSLGEFTLNAGSQTTVSLSDLTETDSGRGVWFDAIRLLPIELLPQADTRSPSDRSWLSERDIAFSWQIENQEKVKATIFQVAEDEAFEDLIVSEEWPGAILSTTVDFGTDYAQLYWRVLVRTESGNEYPSTANRFGIDSQPPASNVRKLYFFEQAGVYRIFWQGVDALSGVAAYNIEYRQEGEETWQSWLSDTQATNAVFSPPDSSAIYQFRSQAVDELGNREVPHSSSDISTEMAFIYSHAVLLPVVSGE